MFRKKEMKYRGINVWVACLCLLLAACDKDDNNDSNNFATGIVELPALRNGANDVFVTHYTTFNGQKVTSFSMEYDKSKKHSRWVAFRFDNQTRLQGATRGDNFIPDPSLDTEYQRTQVDFGKKVMIEGIFVLLPTDFIDKKLTTKPFITRI